MNKMGKIVAIGGGGFDDGEMMPVFEKIVELSGKKNPKVLSLPTAGHDHTDGEAVLEQIFMGLGCSSFKTVTLTTMGLSAEEVRNEILSADIVFAGGGNLEFLMKVWNESGASDALREAFEKGIVLSGVSSGAMCWFDEGYDDCGENGSFMFVDCLGLLPWCNCPHFENAGWQSFIPAVRSRIRSGIACEDGAALVYENGKYEPVYGRLGGTVWLLDKEKNFEMSPVDKESLNR
ncbi:MAG: Type 1 glutamine amidotransferase-like domain-containing protein [Clostridia bacterium]|nr:Type 1 glutamine amidotransferase-like domain-containing protein [Clostridia bacterium]